MGSARADELPEGACAARIPTEQLSQYVGDKVTALIEGQELPLGYSLAFDGVQAEFDIHSTGDPLTDTSDDDRISIHVEINLLDWLDHWAGGFSVFVDLAMRQTPPTAAEVGWGWQVDTDAGYACQYAKVDKEDPVHYYLMTFVEPCVDQEHENVGCSPFLIPGDSRYFDSAPYTSAGHYDWVQSVVHGRQILPESFPEADGCTSSLIIPCVAAAAAPYSLPGITEGDLGKMCHVCERLNFTVHDVRVPPTSFPGVWALGLDAGNFAGDPVSGITTGEPMIQFALSTSGLRDVTFFGQDYPASCALQEMLAEEMDEVLDKPVDPNAEPGDALYVTRREMIAKSGGIRVSANTRSVDLLIPPVTVYEEANCTPRAISGIEYDFDVQFMASGLDIPKVTALEIQADQRAQEFGIHVTCNHGYDCSTVGDEDRDGWCDDVDLCPLIATGVNCDNEPGGGDGHGNGSHAVFSLCLPVTALLAKGELLPGQQQTERLRHYYCGGCDNCQNLRNSAEYPTGVSRPWVPYPTRPESEDRVAIPTRQLDLDNDWLGDGCDADQDGDGIANLYDCAPMNGCLGPDLDRDGKCDGVNGPACSNPFVCAYRCSQSADRYGEEFASTCRAQCTAALDNCAPSTGAADVYCTEVLATCANPDATTPCDAGAALRCRMRYSNPDQETNMGGPEGDLCKAGMTVALQSKFSGVVGGGSGLPLNFHCNLYGDAYSIDLRLWDGGLVDDAFGRPGYESVDHTAVEVGTCACAPGTVIGWDVDCVQNYCPLLSSELNADGEKAWNPVQAPEIAVKKTFHPLETELKYPVVCGDSPDSVCDAEHNSAKWNHLVFGRKMPFSRDPQKNFHRLTWSWQDAKQFPEYEKKVEYSAKTTNRTTRARASWANFGQPYDASFYSSLVSYTDAVPLDVYQRDCSGIVYLGPPFILDYFQGMTDIWLDGRTTASQPPAGWLLGRDPDAERVLLYHLGPDTLQVQGVQELLAPTGVDLLSPATTGAVGILPGTFWGQDGGVQLTLAMYQAGTTPGGDAVGEPPRLLLAALETGAEVNVEDLGVRYGVAIPALTEAHVVILDARQQILIVGRTPAGQVVAHRLRLTEGTWDAPRSLDALAQRRGFGLVHDPAFDRLLAFGGETGGVTHAAEATAEIVAIPLSTLATEVLYLALPETAARSRAGVFLDPVSQRLHVLGGERDGVTLDDGFAVDLRDGAVEAMAAGGGPGALIEPFLYVDRRTGRLWAGDVLGQAGSDGLPLYLRTSDGAWRPVATPVVPETPGYPLVDTYVPGRFYGYFTDVAPEATWPGPVLLGSLEDGGGGLRLAAGTGDGIPLGESEAVAEGVEQVGFRCPPDQRCRMTVAPRPGEWAGNEVPFTLDVRAASLVPAGQFVAPVPIQDVGLYGGRLVVTGVLGLGILDPATLSWVGVAVKPELLVAQATAACGGYLCVARLGLEGLKVVDLSDPASPTVKGSASTAGLGWDLATRGNRVYVAHGALGVGVYDVSSQGHPTRVRTLWPGGVVRTVAVHGDVLAAAQQGGRIQLYRLGSTEQVVGSLTVQGPIDRIRFVAGQLWVLRKNEKRLDVYSVADPAAPVLLGTVTTGASDAFREVWLGARRYSYQGHVLTAQTVTAAQP